LQLLLIRFGKKEKNAQFDESAEGIRWFVVPGHDEKHLGELARGYRKKVLQFPSLVVGAVTGKLSTKDNDHCPFSG